MKNEKLKPHIRVYIVQQLAMFERPTIIQKAIKELFDVDVTVQAVVYYDPKVNTTLPQKWRDVFEQTRRQFIESSAEIPIANKSFRLRELDALYHKQKLAKVPNPVEMRAALDQAAKEAADGYKSRVELTGKDGQKLIPENNGPQVVVYLPDNGRGDAD